MSKFAWSRRKNAVGCRSSNWVTCESVASHKDFNIPHLKKVVDDGYDIVAPIPSCVLMFKQELPLMFPRTRT